MWHLVVSFGIVKCSRPLKERKEICAIFSSAVGIRTVSRAGGHLLVYFAVFQKIGYCYYSSPTVLKELVDISNTGENRASPLDTKRTSWNWGPCLCPMWCISFTLCGDLSSFSICSNWIYLMFWLNNSQHLQAERCMFYCKIRLLGNIDLSQATLV